jgi:DNA (cytosine-5)-methyltransferase 1
MRAIELFAGAGGLGMGISHAGFSPATIIEWDKWCCDTLRENRVGGLIHHWPEPIEGDVRSVDFRKFEGKIELVSGGPPCQPFSLGGKHRAHTDARDMWPEAVRVIRETKPKAFIFENVKGLTRESFATYLSYIVLQLTHPDLAVLPEEDWEDHLRRLEQHHTRGGILNGLEYRVVYRVLNAADYGVPQKRERVVFVGFRSDLDIEWSFPKATHSLDAMLWDQIHGSYWDRHETPKVARVLSNKHMERANRLHEKPDSMPWSTTRDAISDLPDPEREPEKASKYNNHRFQAGARSYPGHTGSPLDEPAKTLKAGVHGVPGGENMLRRPDGSVRYFTVRESARLQTFPDAFRFHGSWSETMRQLGNAVPVKLAHIIARSVKQHLQFGDPKFLDLELSR